MDLIAQCRLEGSFAGFQPFRVYRMSNGMAWQQTDGRQAEVALDRPLARVFREGKACWIEIDGLEGRTGVAHAPGETRRTAPGACAQCADCANATAKPGDASAAA